MTPPRLPQHPAAAGAENEAFLDEIGLDNVLQRIPRLGERRRQRLDPDWAAGVVLGDAARATAQDGGYARVLVDPPCSGLGTLQSRPDLRWRTSPERIAELAGLQARVLRAGAEATRPGGTLVYSVCTISRAEGEDLVDGFLAEHGGEFAVEDLGQGPYLQLLPDRDRTDGFFIARLRRH